MSDTQHLESARLAWLDAQADPIDHAAHTLAAEAEREAEAARVAGMDAETHTCPVCYYGEMQYPPNHYNICPSCGTEFGTDDFGKSHEELRAEWIAGGSKWWSLFQNPPTPPTDS